MDNEQKILGSVPKKKGKRYIVIILVLIILGLMGYYVYDKVIKNTKDQDNSKEEQEVEESKDDEKTPLDRYGVVNAFGVVEKQKFPDDVTMDIVAYTNDDKIINIYSIDKEFLKNVVSKDDIVNLSKNINIDYYENKLYIQLHDQLYYIDLAKNEYKLTKIDVTLPSKYCKDIYIVDGIIYFNQGDAKNFIYNISTKQLTNFPNDIINFIIKKDTKQIIFVKLVENQVLYWAPLSDMNSSNIIFSSNLTRITYYNYYNDNVIFETLNDPNINFYDYKKKIYNLSDREKKETTLPFKSNVMVIDNEIYYSEQKTVMGSNNTVESLILNIYKYENDNSKLIYKFTTGPNGNEAEYIGDNKILLMDNNDNGVDKIIDINGKEVDYTITNLDDSTKKLDLSKSDRVKFEYINVE